LEDPGTIFVGLADQFTSALLKAIELADAAHLTEVDRSYLSLPSISPHEQNSHHPEWTILIHLCRRSFDESRKRDADEGRALLQRWLNLWKSTRYSIFRRLALYASAVWPVIPTSHPYRILLEPREAALWNLDCHREVMQFLRLRATRFTRAQLRILSARILEGPPRSMYRADLEEGDFDQLKRRMISLRLGKLVEGGASLSEEAHLIGEAYLSARSAEMSQDDRDEFLVWSGGAHWMPKPSSDHLTDLAPDEAASQIMEESDEWSAGNIVEDYMRRASTVHWTCWIVSRPMARIAPGSGTVLFTVSKIT